jgi:outer membrane protein assembly factor BamB
LCFDAVTGKKLWQRSILATGNTVCHPKTSMAAPTPATDGKAVYALFATADLVAYDRDGNLLWYRSLVSDYPTVTNQVGMASSPMLAGDVLVLPMDNAGESFIAGLDLRSGRNRWKVERVRDINWVTPAIRTVGKRTEVIFPAQKELVAYDAATGNRVWGFDGEGKISTIPSAIVGEKNEVLVPAGDLISLQPGGEGETPQVLWKSNRLKTGGYSTPLYYDGHVYALNSVGVLVCGDAKSGKMLWDVRLKGPFSASPIAADGRIFAVNEKGVTQVVKLGEKPEIEATNDLNDDMQATPAIAGGCIFLRSDSTLYCIGK